MTDSLFPDLAPTPSARLCSCGCGQKAIYVGRPGRWGNPWRIQPTKDRGYVDIHNSDADTFLGRVRAEQGRYWATEGYRLYRPDLDAIRAALRGHDLMCWCPLDTPCHADILLELANPEATS